MVRRDPPGLVGCRRFRLRWRVHQTAAGTCQAEAVRRQQADSDERGGVAGGTGVRDPQLRRAVLHDAERQTGRIRRAHCQREVAGAAGRTRDRCLYRRRDHLLPHAARGGGVLSPLGDRQRRLGRGGPHHGDARRDAGQVPRRFPGAPPASGQWHGRRADCRRSGHGGARTGTARRGRCQGYRAVVRELSRRAAVVPRRGDAAAGAHGDFAGRNSANRRGTCPGRVPASQPPSSWPP